MQCKMKWQFDRIIPSIQWLRFWIAIRKTRVLFKGILKCLVEQKEKGYSLLSREVYLHWKIGTWNMMPKPLRNWTISNQVMMRCQNFLSCNYLCSTWMPTFICSVV